LAGHKFDVPAEFKFGETNKTPEYLAKFPLGKIPTFEGSDGFNLSEGNAIAYYLADIAPAAVRDQLIGSTPHQRAKSRFSITINIENRTWSDADNRLL